ncbi:MAG: RagB/SusD family nutrient uptake outer membrane protein, partial [Bacteroides sp.]|nr:RagB/SusD family nutrient uptake outer membrane protein [Bacteroides sp.]
MKTKLISYICIAILSVYALSSCLGDLDTLPLDDNQLIKEDAYSTAEGYIGVIAKCYASLILTGQGGSNSNDLGDMDEGYGGYTRGLFYLQEGGSDEVLFGAGSGYGTRAMLYLNWDPSTQVIKFPYYRLYMAIGYCNEFLRECTEEKMTDRGVYDALKNEYEYYRAEARLIRAYCYSMICDLYGSAPFVDETMGVGIFPEQKTRKEIYDYVVSECEELKTLLKEPGQNEYGRVDRVSAWFLLARTYLNGGIWAGANDFDKAYTYAKMVIENGTYSLASDYRHIFLADNDNCPEIIWGLVQDSDNARGSAGTNFLVKALANGSMSDHITGTNDHWGNGVTKEALVNLFEEADQLYDLEDKWGDHKGDKRAQFYSVTRDKDGNLVSRNKETRKEPGASFAWDFSYGYPIIKWRNLTKDRQELVPGGDTYISIDYPMFRMADAYLMAAEAILRNGGGTPEEALGYVNEVRDRAYMYGDYEASYATPVNGRITLQELTLDFILDERGRELYTENIRRTDLVRFGKYTKGYNWDWKGGNGEADSYHGKDVDDKYNLFPIPQDDLTTNPN